MKAELHEWAADSPRSDVMGHDTPLLHDPASFEVLKAQTTGANRLTTKQTAELSWLIHAGEEAKAQLGADEDMFDPELAEMAKTGDMARETLALANLGLVRMVVNRRITGLNYSPDAKSMYDDLMQDGYLTLREIVDGFDPTLGFSFSTFAARVLSGEVKEASWKYRRGMRVSNRVHLHDIAISRAVRELSATLHREPTDAELAERTELSEERIKEVRAYLRPVVSLETPLDARNKDSQTILDVASDMPHIEHDDEDLRDENDEALAKLIGYLPIKQQYIMRNLYGLDGIVKTPEELADEMNIGRESVKRSYERAKARMRLLSYMDDSGHLIVSHNRDTPIAS